MAQDFPVAHGRTNLLVQAAICYGLGGGALKSKVDMQITWSIFSSS